MAKNYTKFNNGFQVGTDASIDKRFLVTSDPSNKEYFKMIDADETYLIPDKYFAMCVDDGKFYIYDKKNSLDEKYGRFRPIEDRLDFGTSEESKEKIDTAIDNNETVINIKNDIYDDTGKNRIEALEEQVNNLLMDGGEIS